MKKEEKLAEELIKLRDKLSGLLASAQVELDKVKDLIPKNVFDPIKWLEKNRPDLMKNQKLVDALTLAMKLSEKESKKHLKRKTRVSYEIRVEPEEARSMRSLIKYYVEDYCGGKLDHDEPSPELDYYGKVLKGLNYFQGLDYISDNPLVLKLNPKEVACLIHAFGQYVEDNEEFVKDMEKWELEKFEGVVKTFKGILEKEVVKYSSTTVPYVDDEGVLKLKFEDKEEKLRLIGKQ